MKNVLLLLVILAASVSPVAAQSSADGLDSTLVAYYRWCNRHKQDPEMLLKADTMFRLAGEKQNRRMQAVALCLKTDYYYYTNKFDSVKVWVARTQQFTRQHNQPTHYYFVWTRLISYYTKYSKYTLAQYELERFLDQAIRDDYKPAIAEAYKHLGHIYRTKSLYNTAIDTYLKAIDVAERNGLKEVDVSDLYLQLGEMYTQQRKYDQSERALRMAEKTILLPEHIWRVRIAQANLHAEEGEFARARQLLREIRDGSNGYASENKVREIELSIYKHSGELHKALEIVNKQLAPYEKTRDSTHYFYIPMLGTRAAINYELGNYKASAEDLSRQMALAQKKYDQSNRETLNEFATLFDVERLDREKAEAQQQAQAERLRRARVFEISLGVILLLASIFIFILTRLNRRLAHAKHAAEQASRMKGIFIRNIPRNQHPAERDRRIRRTGLDGPGKRPRARCLHRHHTRKQRVPAKTRGRRALHRRPRIVGHPARQCAGRHQRLLPGVHPRAFETRHGGDRDPIPSGTREIHGRNLVRAAHQSAHRTAAQRRAVHRTGRNGIALLRRGTGRPERHLRR